MAPDANQLIVNSAWRAARGDLASAPRTPGLCLKLVRVIIEHALHWRSHELYERYLVAGTTRRPGTDAERLAAARREPYAADIERSMKQLDLAVALADRQPGDLIFNHHAAPPYGHVGILLDHSTVLELIDARYRPLSVTLPGSLAITPLESRPWTLVARIDG